MMLNKQRLFTIVSSLLLGILPFTGALADEVDDAKAERCISITRIDTTHVLDDRRILFYMRGHDVYLNQLPSRCGGLGFEKRFMYRTSLSQLCDLDTITVLYDQAGGFTPGATCGLGKFQPISEEDADALRTAKPAEPQAEELPTAEPEEIGEPE